MRSHPFHRWIFTVVIIYGVCASSWIFLSDHLLEWLLADSHLIVQASLYKGWFFVALTAFLLYTLLHHQRHQLQIADKTQQAQAEQIKTLRLLAAIADSSEDAIFAKDLGGHYTLFNRAACQVVGKTESLVLGQNDFALFPAAQALENIRSDRCLISEMSLLTHEDYLDTAIGPRIFLSTKGPLLDDAGNVVGIFGISRDITERKQAEIALRDSEVRFRTLFDNAAVSIMIHHCETGEILDANRKAITTYGYATLAQLQRSEFWLASPYGQNEAAALIQQAALTGPRRFEWKNQNIHGQVFWEEVLLHTICLEGQQQVLSIATDITERKLAQDALAHQADELSRRNAELERFNRAMVGREMDMIDLKKKINALSVQLGMEPPYSGELLESGRQTVIAQGSPCRA